MRQEAIQLEEERLRDISEMADYQAHHERHRAFPAVFENRRLSRIIDIAAGVGVVGKRILDEYPAEIICNDVCPKCLRTMERSGLTTVSFDIDDKEGRFPFPEGDFDAVIALATIEHLINIDHFLEEVHRILRDGGYLYISAPNYAGLTYILPFLVTGRTFHDPLSEPSRYEFYAHVRYFTYRTLLEFVGSHDFAPDSVYLPLPESSSRYLLLKRQSTFKATVFRNAMKIMYRLSPRWSAEPVLCFRKPGKGWDGKIRSVII